MYSETYACGGGPSARSSLSALVRAAWGGEENSPGEPLPPPPSPVEELEPPPPQPAIRPVPSTARRSRAATDLPFILTALLYPGQRLICHRRCLPPRRRRRF